ncbi:MAG: nickel/cobalt transporter (NicO) family protein, partial [Frankiaceae bacterium]|nr:nickel/cobalt transporter (NicO) family protein [Frankiaceae bacterium]
HGHGHGHQSGDIPRGRAEVALGVMTAATATVAAPGRVSGVVDHSHGHSHGHDIGRNHGYGHQQGHEHPTSSRHDNGSSHSHTDEREPEPAAGAGDDVEGRGFRRLTIVGMGLAGGLVPSPTALVVLLAAIALGRTAFGVLLVIGYGVGMAATLIGVGYLIAVTRKRMPRVSVLSERPLVARLLANGPVLTACLVLVVGIGLALRSAAPLA